MGLKTMSLKQSPTSIDVTGGTALTFMPTGGMNIANGVYLMVPTDVDYQVRRSIVAKVRPSSIDAKTGEFGKDKKSISFVIPTVLPSGRIVFNTLRIEREVHPYTSASEIAQLNTVGAQLLTDADTDNFWAYGSLD